MTKWTNLNETELGEEDFDDGEDLDEMPEEGTMQVFV